MSETTSDLPRVATFLNRIITEANDTPLSEIPLVGSYGREYLNGLDQRTVDLDAVSEGIHTAAVVVMEAITRVRRATEIAAADPDSDATSDYLAGLVDGRQSFAQMVGGALQVLQDDLRRARHIKDSLADLAGSV